METVLGKLNGTFLVNFLTRSYPLSKSVSTAVAYADMYEPWLNHLERHPEVRLTFYGRMDETCPVSLRLLRWFLKKAPSTAKCYLVNGAFHPKVIWWHGYGAYVGSANLTDNGWTRNIEAGVFLGEDELYESGVAPQLDALFGMLERVAVQLTDELYADLERVERERERLRPQLDAIKRRYVELLGDEKPYAGQTSVFRPSEQVSKARREFVTEWRETLQLMRTLWREFQAMQKRPHWVNAGRQPHGAFRPISARLLLPRRAQSNGRGGQGDKGRAAL